MGKVGKPQKPPGYQQVAQQRKLWEQLKQKHLTYPWFVEELEKEIKAYEEYLRDQPWKDWQSYRKLVWSDKRKKWTYATMNAEERLYWRTFYVGNGMKDIDDYRDVIQVTSWGLESRMILQDLLSERKKAVVYELYKQEKEKKCLGNEDNKPTASSQKKVKFSSNLIFIP